MENEKPNKATDNLMKTGLATLIGAVKTSNDLPSCGSNWAFYSSFPAFQTLMNAQASKILMIMQRCINHQQAKGSVLESVGYREVSDRFESLVEINDQLLERIQGQLDEAAGIKPPGVELCVSAEPRKFGRFTMRDGAAAAAKEAAPKPAATAAGAGAAASGRRVQLGERHMTRPQLRFARPPDNSAEPFRPKLTSKPHAKLPLKDSLLIRNVEGSEAAGFPHPYQAELEALSPPDTLCKVSEKTQTALPLDETPLTMVRTKAALKQLVTYLQSQKEIAVDLEHHAFRTYLGLTCLMQISTWEQDFIVDTLELWDHLERLNVVFADPGILKVFHGASSDILWLQRDFGLYVVNMFDTGIAARFLGHSRTGLGVLLEHFCGVNTDKTYQLADWRQRPLSEGMLTYARKDTHYLLEVGQKQRSRLMAQGRPEIVEAIWKESRQLCLSRYEKPESSDANYLELYRSVRKQFSGPQLAALKSLVRWRDEVARVEDESHAFVLPDHMLVMICDTLPREHSGVFACCNPIPALVRKFIHDIHRLVLEARDSKTEASSLTVQPPQTPVEASADNLVSSPHDLSHTEAREAPKPLATTEERALLTALLKRSSPAVRLRPASGFSGGGCKRRLSREEDPLSKYLLTATDFELKPPEKDFVQPNADANGSPGPASKTPEEDPAFRLQPTKKKSRLEKKPSGGSQKVQEAAPKEDEESNKERADDEERVKERSEGEEEEEEEGMSEGDGSFEPFDYSSAQLPKSNATRRPADRMLAQEPKNTKPSQKKKAQKTSKKKKLRT